VRNDAHHLAIAPSCVTGQITRVAMRSAMAVLCWVTTSMLAQQPFRPEIPKTWESVALATLEVPQPDPRYSPIPVRVEYYYRVPIRPVHKMIPIVHCAWRYLQKPFVHGMEGNALYACIDTKWRPS